MTVLAFIACAAVAGILIYGISGFGRGTMSPKQQNKVMQWRIAAQFVAVVLILIAVTAGSD
ncbi:MAG: twin transmembrane helix small protein [Pseudomonadota bacterium]